jgi:head-tail adaptor
MTHVPGGMLRLVMTVQNRSVSVDAFGQQTETWSDVAMIAVHAEQMNTSEVMDDGGPAVRTDWRILAAWHPSVTTRSRLKWLDGITTRYFNLRSCYDRDNRQRRLEIEATEVLP